MILFIFQNLENEILAKQTEVSALNTKMDLLRGDTAIVSRISRILNKYQSLKNTAKVYTIFHSFTFFYIFNKNCNGLFYLYQFNSFRETELL